MPDLTAIAATADQMAMGALAQLRARGLRCPDDVSVIGCNDIWPSRDTWPPLTTVHLPLAEAGRHALRLGIAALAGEVTRDHLPVHLVVRESTGPARR
ncbi:substrate-binding domain-containing protein [Aestuariimicrobium ganziense]|uniref:substrate-binding domain-containing protein n=1 Tax=Aestuariimicrobium ganziense TaxID=2773677 RepID=UPI00194101B3|nr:LacI family DNA-binding transcriptional regulator [Aestuariimicrobium ganziense]